MERMGTLYVFVIIVTLSTHCSAYLVSHSETDRSKASVILKEGQSAEILCMTKGTGDFFWWKGETLYSSTLVASFTVGEVSDDSQPYSVTVNGTLHIRSVTLKDEGNYFCRLSSTENECYGEVKILVQASLFNFDLAIDRCDRQSSCLLYLDPSQSTSLTCTALNAPPLMTLKWFNGSKEITEGILQNELLSQNGKSREITSTVAAVYGRPTSLTCQAVDPKRSNDDVRFAHAQVEMTVPAQETLPTWLIVSVTLAGCFIVFGIVLLIKAKVNRKQHKKYTKLKREDVEALTEKVNTNEETINAKHQELTEFKGTLRQTEEDLKKSKKEIIELQGKLRQTEEELKQSRNKNIELQKTISNALANDKVKTAYAETSAEKYTKEITELKMSAEKYTKEITELKTSAEKYTKEITELKTSAEKYTKEITELKTSAEKYTKEITELKTSAEKYTKEITELKDKLRQQEEEIEKERNANTQLQTTSAIAAGETTVVEELAESRNKEISGLKKKVEQQEKEINNQREKYSDCQTNLHKKEIALQGKSFEISDLKSKLKEKDSVLGKISKELTNLKEDLAKKERAKEQKSS